MLGFLFHQCFRCTNNNMVDRVGLEPTRPKGKRVTAVDATNYALPIRISFSALTNSSVPIANNGIKDSDVT